MSLKEIAKAVVAVLGVLVVVGNGLADDGHLSVDEIVAIATALGVALGVYTVPNRPAVPKVAHVESGPGAGV